MISIVKRQLLVNYILFFFVISVLAGPLFTFSLNGGNFFIAGKNNSFLLLVGLLACAFSIITFIRILKGKIITFKSHIIDFVVLIWLAYICINISIHKNSVFDNDWLAFLGCIMFYFLIRIIFQNTLPKSFKQTLLCGLLLMSILELAIGLLQLYNILPSFNEYFKITGTFRNPAPFSLFVAACYPIGLCIYFFSRDNIGLHRVATINCILLFITLPSAQNRASWIAIFVITIIISIVKFNIINRFKKLISKRSKWGIMFFFLVAFLGLNGLIYCIYNIRSVSADARLLIWEVTFHKLGDNPFFGQGYGAFQQNYDKWQIAYFEKHPDIINQNYFGEVSIGDFAGYVKTTYNEYLNITIEQGIIGLIIFTTLIALIIYNSIEHLKMQSSAYLLGILCSVGVILITALTSYPFYSLPTFILFFFLIALITNEYINTIKSKTITDTWQLPFAVTVLLIGSIYIYIYCYYFNSYDNYSKASIAFKRGNVTKAGNIYKHIFPALKNDPYFLLDFGVCLMKDNELRYAEEILLLAENKDTNPEIYICLGNITKEWKQYERAEQYYKKANLIIPSKIYPKYLLVKLYLESNNRNKAIKMANNILDTKVKITSDLSNQIISEMNSLVKNYSQLKN